MYVTHPSTHLTNIFSDKPYQGVAPDQAKFLFIGLDANYDADIAGKQIFSKIISYHNDGVVFWNENGVHHPFLLPEYSGGGKVYHRNFSRIGFRPEHANLVSFVELLHVPTVGRNKLVATDLEVSHLRMLNNAILEGQANFIFISDKVHRLMIASGEFPWLIKKPENYEGPLGILYRNNSKTVYKHLHFSNYGVFAERMTKEAISIGSLLPRVQ